MDSFPLQTIGGLDTLTTLFNAMAALFQGPLIKSFTILATGIGAVSAMLYTIWRNDLKPLSHWFISYQVLALFLLSPLARVHITDTLTGRFHVIDHVPFALAVTASTLSSLSVSLTQTLEQVMQPLPASGTDPFTPTSYSQTGFMFGAQSLIQMRSIHITNQDMADNMKEFVNQCVVYAALNGNRYTLEDLQKSGDIWGLISESPSKLLGFSWRQVERDGEGRFLRSNGTEIITCSEGISRFNALWAHATDHALSSFYQRLSSIFGKSSTPTHTPLSACAATYFPGALNKLTHQAQSASDRVRQQMMMTTLVQSNIQKTQELGGHPNFEVMRAYFQQRQTYQTIGETVSQTLLSLKNVLEALAYGLFIFVVMMALLPNGWKMLLFWVKVISWIQLWPPLFAVLNFLMTEYLAFSVQSQVGTASGLTLWNFVGITHIASDMAATAGYLSCLIPVLAWALLDQGGYAFVSMASQLLGVSQGAATSAALEKTTGNYSFGNVSLDGVQSDQTHLFKHDTSASYSGGHFAVQDGLSSRLFAANGEQLVNRQISQLPVTIRGSEAYEQVYRSLANEAESFSLSESEQATQSHQAMASDYLQVGKHASHLIQAGEQFSHHQTTTSLQEAAQAYNQAKRISDEFGISEELVNQKLAEASSGLSISIDPLTLGPVHFSANMGGNLGKQEMSSARANQAAQAIQELGQSEDFRRSLQHGYQALQGKTFDMTDQNLKESIHNYASNYEKAVSHQQNASKAYETSRALQKEMGVNRSQSVALDSNYTQEFVNAVGADRLEHMSVHDMEQEAQSFITHKTKSLEGTLRHHHNLKNSYNSTQLPGSIEEPQEVRNQNRTRVQNQSSQEGLVLDRPISADTALQARQMLDTNQFQTMRLGKSLTDRHAHQQEGFKEKVKKHAQDDMGLTQESATEAMHTYFEQEEVKPLPPQEYTAVNLEPKHGKG